MLRAEERRPVERVTTPAAVTVKCATSLNVSLSARGALRHGRRDAVAQEGSRLPPVVGVILGRKALT